MTDCSNLDRQIEQLKQCEIIKENEVKALCAKAREILVEEGNVQRVDSPVTVIFCVNICIIIKIFKKLPNFRFAEIFTVNFMT